MTFASKQPTATGLGNMDYLAVTNGTPLAFVKQPSCTERQPWYNYINCRELADQSHVKESTIRFITQSGPQRDRRQLKRLHESTRDQLICVMAGRQAR